MIRIHKIFLSVILSAAALLCGCSAEEAQEITPPFFEVYDSETNGHVYLLGSMHAGYPNTTYPQELLDALAESELIACEVDTVALSESIEELSEAMELLLCDEGMTTADYLGDDYELVKSFFTMKGMYSAAFDSYLPAMWSSTLSNMIASDCGMDSDYGTETVLLSYAKSLDKPIYEIETAALQYGIMAQAPMAFQIYQLVEAVSKDYSEQLDEMERLYAAWSNSDGDTITAMLDAEAVPEDLSEDYDAYYRTMYTDRQQVMSECVIEWLSEGKTVFMLVGALHFYAEPDILTNLSEAGYIVSQVELSSRCSSTQAA